MDSERERTILIVEDEQSLAALHAHHLQDDYEARVAFTGGEALVELTSDIDLVLLDRRMPGMSGDELLEHIDDWESDCQVIMVPPSTRISTSSICRLRAISPNQSLRTSC